MNAMKMPGFSAEFSLSNDNKSKFHIIIMGKEVGRFRYIAIIAQLPPPSGDRPSIAECVLNCTDKHPDWTVEKCSKICTPPVAPAPAPSPPSGCDSNCWACKIGCYTWYGACMINPLGFGCAYVRDQCLAGC